MRKSIELQFATNGSFFDIMGGIQRFYSILDLPIAKAQKIAYPNERKTHTSGMKISAQLVTCLEIIIWSEGFSVGDCAITQSTM